MEITTTLVVDIVLTILTIAGLFGSIYACIKVTSIKTTLDVIVEAYERNSRIYSDIASVGALMLAVWFGLWMYVVVSSILWLAIIAVCEYQLSKKYHVFN